MNFEQLKQVCDEMRMLELGKKKYPEVAERVTAFRKLYPEGQILTRLVKYEDKVVIFSASITDGEKVLATGTAKEIEGSTNINRTSAIENCETSAVGRALGFLGLTGGSIASYEEAQNAKLQQEAVKLATDTEKAGFVASCNAKGLDYEFVLKEIGFDRNKQPEGMTVEQYGKAMEYVNKYQESDRD